MDRKKSILFIICALFIIGNIQAKEPGFDVVCRIYTEAQNSSMTKQQLSDYVNNNIAERVSDKDAFTTHSIIFQVSPDERYKIFKESAEHSLKRKWNCAAMKTLMK
jgi:hypothetical protein